METLIAVSGKTKKQWMDEERPTTSMEVSIYGPERPVAFRYRTQDGGKIEVLVMPQITK
jgi:hypothetical protein